MAAKKILVVEDEAAIRDMLAFNLGRAGFEVLAAADGQEARRMIADGHPDVILMDWMLPGVSGLELTHQLKRDAATKDIPVIMVTARAQEDDRVAGLDGGADDYITKPFSPRELEARIKAVLRRSAPADDEVISVGELRLDRACHRVSIGGVGSHDSHALRSVVCINRPSCSRVDDVRVTLALVFAKSLIAARGDETHQFAARPNRIITARIGIVCLNFKRHQFAVWAIPIAFRHRRFATDEFALVPGDPAIHAGFTWRIELGKFG